MGGPFKKSPSPAAMAPRQGPNGQALLHCVKRLRLRRQTLMALVPMRVPDPVTPPQLRRRSRRIEQPVPLLLPTPVRLTVPKPLVVLPSCVTAAQPLLLLRQPPSLREVTRKLPHLLLKE